MVLAITVFSAFIIFIVPIHKINKLINNKVINNENNPIDNRPIKEIVDELFNFFREDLNDFDYSVTKTDYYCNKKYRKI